MFPRCLTMEETFIVTYIFIIVIGVLLGFLVYWAFEKDNANEGHEEYEDYDG